ncbi:hypothetical protein BDZ89DRAFT_1058449 [Hymenopellis radicata]|nr:hypothetical protein BDZ89DRAFT_1058449 [Hymenopellis radicata]
MADLYPPSRHFSQNSSLLYPPQTAVDTVDDNDTDGPTNGDQRSSQPPKNETKPQATFLTKLYALLERPENHHMIRWDPQGEHIIVERPEQLALHVLPSIYRQSRFASFSRQLNIYGFMRKVNLRNVDPAIDDPDASTWSHPTLNRHSPPEVVANFKRRVPPQIGRARGFSAPGSFTPLSQAGPGAWSNSSYSHRSALPPLTVPEPQHSIHNNYHHPSHHTLPPPISPAEESTFAYSSNPYPPSNTYHPEQGNTWSFSPVSSSSSSHNGSLSSLLNPSTHNSGYTRPTPTINTSYNSSPFSSMPMEHSSSSLSPDSHSRPTTGYSMSSVSSMGYGDDHMQHDYHPSSRPSSSHHHGRPMTPPRPSSSKSPYSNSLSIRRARRHSQALSPYPSPMYEHDQRPSTSPQPTSGHHAHPAHHSQQDTGVPRVRSMIQLPSVLPPVEHYSFSPQAEFAYSGPGPMEYRPSTGNGRPSTGTSATSSSHANTPPVTDGFGAETDINRYDSPDFGYMQMNEHLPVPVPNGYVKEM